MLVKFNIQLEYITVSVTWETQAATWTRPKSPTEIGTRSRSLGAESSRSRRRKRRRRRYRSRRRHTNLNYLSALGTWPARLLAKDEPTIPSSLPFPFRHPSFSLALSFSHADAAGLSGKVMCKSFWPPQNVRIVLYSYAYLGTVNEWAIAGCRVGAREGWRTNEERLVRVRVRGREWW